MKIKGWRLWGWLSLIFTSTLLLTVLTVYGLTMLENRQQFERREGQLLISIGRQLAKDPRVTAALEANKADSATRTYAGTVEKNFDLDFVVIMNMQGIRLTHPDPKQINRHFQGGDEVTALRGHEHVSVRRGTLGRSLQTLIKTSQDGFRLALFAGTIMGLLTAFLVAYYIKHQLHDLEPKEIARLLEERNAMLEETKDPVIVIDLHQVIMLINKAAAKLQNHLITESAFIGQPLTTLIANPERVNLNVKTEQFYQQDGQDYLFSAAPIMVKKQKIGYVIFLRNATEAIFVADQLANTTAYANALQSQSHEFMNKLHVIYGLVAIKQYDELAIYLQDLLKPEQEFANRLALLVKNPLVAGFMIGEREKFAERKTTLDFEISPELPPNPNTQETKTLLTLSRYLHFGLLQHDLPDTILIQLEYAQNRLTIVYHLDEPAKRTDFISLIHQDYFQQLLTELNGSVTVSSTDPLTLTLTVDYHEEAQNDEHSNR
ncbi:Spo0B domain-containing protein [Lacticaseibacillus paracasei]|uniref:Spo0B domain-containing protein n=1 Tax=Lacticaseibacillus paracasei TaxID=1597 RepID=UPI0022E07E6F|nr:Spo0B domain-containing protein [Lacticaseibacillus paracasei]